jgi:hypothetical protein
MVIGRDTPVWQPPGAMISPAPYPSSTLPCLSLAYRGKDTPPWQVIAHPDPPLRSLPLCLNLTKEENVRFKAFAGSIGHYRAKKG